LGIVMPSHAETWSMSCFDTDELTARSESIPSRGEPESEIHSTRWHYRTIGSVVSVDMTATMLHGISIDVGRTRGCEDTFISGVSSFYFATQGYRRSALSAASHSGRFVLERLIVTAIRMFAVSRPGWTAQQ
jgi:hypothetical protein